MIVPKAHKTALSVKPDLITLDLMMPNPDGFKLCRKFRSDLNFTFTPIIIVTALGGDDDDDKEPIIAAFGAGANDFITKPFHSNEFVERIRKLTI